jgi:hypothetical protein
VIKPSYNAVDPDMTQRDSARGDGASAEKWLAEMKRQMKDCHNSCPLFCGKMCRVWHSESTALAERSSRLCTAQIVARAAEMCGVMPQKEARR